MVLGLSFRNHKHNQQSLLSSPMEGGDLSMYSAMERKWLKSMTSRPMKLSTGKSRILPPSRKANGSGKSVMVSRKWERNRS